MKITNVNYSDEPSGSSIAVSRIHNMLINEKIDSNILVFKSNDQKFESKNIKRFDEYLRLLFKRLFKKILQLFFSIKYKYTINFGILPSFFLKKINNSNCDIINLHWIGNEILSINQISKINKPTIWTLHDMWPYSSVENYIDTIDYLEKYVEGNSKIDFFSKFIFKKKIKKFRNIKSLICTSNWQLKMCEKNQIFKNAKKILIPLPLDFKHWKPITKNLAREKLKIPLNAKVVFYNLSHIYAKKRKGFDFVLNFLENTNLSNLYFISTNCNSIQIENSKINHFNFDKIEKIEERIQLYSAADVLLSPSRLESFGQTVLEAQACGIPAVTFKNTGSDDLIYNMKTGYSSNYLDQNDFNKGVEWCLNNSFNKQMIIDLAKEKFSFEAVGSKYKNFLNSIIKE